MSNPLLIERSGAVTRLRFNRPERLNAIDAGMAAALVGVILAARECEPAEDAGDEHRAAGRAAIGDARATAGSCWARRGS